MPVSINIAQNSRPPLNLFEVRRASLAANTWTTLYDVPQYVIPANGPNPSRTINTAAIMTGIVITNNVTEDLDISIRVVDTNNSNTEYNILNTAPVPTNDLVTIGLDRQVLLTGEQLQVKASNNAIAHFSFILNQREEFTTA